MGVHKVFVIGLQKTGTSSVGGALEALGFRVCGAVGSWWPEIGTVAARAATRIVPDYDAFQDAPWFALVPDLAKHHPQARFLLTTRPVEAWIVSMRRYFARGFSPFETWFYGAPSISDMTDAELRAAFAGHLDWTRALFRATPDRLFEFRLGQDDWAELRAACGMPGGDPGRPFPYLNAGLAADGPVPLATPQPDEAMLRRTLGLPPL